MPDFDWQTINLACKLEKNLSYTKIKSYIKIYIKESTIFTCWKRIPSQLLFEL